MSVSGQTVPTSWDFCCELVSLIYGVKTIVDSCHSKFKRKNEGKAFIKLTATVIIGQLSMLAILLTKSFDYMGY